MHYFAAVVVAVISFCAVSCNSLSLNNPIQASYWACHVHVERPQYKVQLRGQRQSYHHARSAAPIYSTQLHQTSVSSDSNRSSNNGILAKLSNYDLSVPAVLLAAFLNLLGFTMASPIQPALGKHFSLPLGASFGSLSSAYPLGMLLGVFFWPTLSDILGRKIVMSTTLLGSGLGLMLQSWGIRQCWSLEQFLAARVLTGCFAGNSPISKAYLADRGSEGNNSKGNLAKYLAWKDAASTLAFIVGPVLGGLVYQFFAPVLGGGDNVTNQISFVILCSAMASLVASLSVMLFVKNTDKDNTMLRKTVKDEGVEIGNDSSEQNTSTTDTGSDTEKPRTDIDKTYDSNGTEIISCPLGSTLWTGVASVAVVSALYHAADSTFFAFFPSLLQNRLGFDTQAVGMAFTSFAFVSFTMSAFVSSKFLKAFGPVAACTTGLGAVATGLMTLGYAASLPASASMAVTAAFIFGASALYYTGVPLYGPSVPTMLLQCVPSQKRGAVMGFDGAINTIARVISPLVIGEIHRVRGAGACFKVAGSCVYAAMSVALLRRWLVLRKAFGKKQLSNTE